MTILELIDKVSEMYRKDRDQINNMRLEQLQISDEFRAASEKEWETMSVARRNELHNRDAYLSRKIDVLTYHCEGISDVREMLLDMFENGEEIEEDSDEQKD